MLLSYAQNLEDYHLSLAFAGQSSGFYIDVGAGHPVADNVTQFFYERGWRGIVAEPQPELAALYGRLRPRDAVFEGLVGRRDGEARFHQVERLHGFSTTVEEHARAAGAFGAAYETRVLPCLTLATLCERHKVTAIDILKIDVEGAEADVLAGNDWSRFRPAVVVAEAVTPGAGDRAWDAWEPELLARGYRFRLFDTLNRFYVAQERPDVFERLPAERADWGAATHMYEIGRAPENAAHPDHALAGALAKGFWADLPNIPLDALARVLVRGRGEEASPDALAAARAEIETDAFRAALGRIACGYDGGQIHDE
ncbi:FkbM family methyltransferase [Alsobacter sp. SYSU M60028]|uniref:FkbM family methyltransferase n=1 Tax=Alsobacter ponti TaxID=2962936 RepID=A0ABT1L6V1_9HYPH|nr:FkbM family methyltransferase [Alsobacter ponti]MCP8937157.1 FkbM family methyltransferase [Alsobacter ponti]